MSPRLPSLKARQIMRAAERAGFEQVRSKGSHRVFQHRDDAKRRTIVADHGNADIPRGTLSSIIAQAGLSVDAFIALV